VVADEVGRSRKAVPPPAHVVVEMDGQIVGEYPLNKPVLTVGRLAGNDVPIPEQRVSRLHAKIYAEQGAWMIEDIESINGMVYQGKRVERLALADGDDVYIAPNVVLHYVLDLATPPGEDG
jgi:pSer/pThr/pTyr-binding forkhead associated (FHA) protein